MSDHWQCATVSSTKFGKKLQPIKRRIEAARLVAYNGLQMKTSGRIGKICWEVCVGTHVYYMLSSESMSCVNGR